MTDKPARKPADVFHSRLEISPNGKYLLSKGWIWHPLNVVQAYNISDCFKNPLLLDVLNWNNPKVGTEICTASFINDSEVLIGSSEDEIVNEDFIEILPQKSMAIWNLNSNKISKPISLKFNFGNLVAINDRLAWDICDFPKVINLHTGEIVLKEENIQTGNQCTSIIYDTSNFKQVVFNKPKTKLAILDKSDSFSVVSLE